MSGFSPRRKRMSSFSSSSSSSASPETGTPIHYADVRALQGCLSDTGKIVPARITGIDARTQRLVAKEIKRARFIALLPYCDSHR